MLIFTNLEENLEIPTTSHEVLAVIKHNQCKCKEWFLVVSLKCPYLLQGLSCGRRDAADTVEKVPGNTWEVTEIK